MMISRGVAAFAASAWLMITVACGPIVRRDHASLAAPVDAVQLPSDGRASHRLTLAELSTIDGTVGDAVRRLRPEFLRQRAPSSGRGDASATPSVHVNGRYMGDVSVLELIRAGDASEVRFLDPVAAKSVRGSYCRCEHGAIFVRLKL